MRVAVRLYSGGVRQSEEMLTISEAEIEALVPELAARHARLMAACSGVVELEFLDEPDVNQRFFRIGTETTGMVMPIAFCAACLKPLMNCECGQDE